MLETMIWGGLRVAATLLLMMGVVLALRSASAATRHAVWRAGFGMALLLPVLAFALPWKLEILPGRPGSAEVEPAYGGFEWKEASNASAPVGEAPAMRDLGMDGGAPIDEGAAGPAPVIDAAASSSFDWPLFLLVVWLAGAALLVARLIAGHLAVGRIVRGGRRLTSADWTSPLYEAADIVDVAVDVELVTSDRVTMPFTAGVRRPVIVLPATSESWSLDRRRAVLMHELAHVRRRDLVPHHVARWVCALHWFNPLAWSGARRMRAESERAADDLVLTAGTRPSEYADHLLQIVSSAGRSLMPAPALPLAQRREFEGRMLAILEPGIRRRGPGRVQSLVVTALVLLMTLPLAALEREGTQPERESELAIERSDASAVDDETPSHSNDAYTADLHVEAAPSVDPVMGGVRDHAKPKFGLLRSIVEDALGPQAGEEAQATGSVPPEAIPALIRTLSDANIDVRTAAVSALGELGDPRAVQALIRVLREDTSAEVRAAAAWALGEIEDAAAVSALTDALRNDAGDGVRQNAAWALGQIEDARAVDALGAALRDRNLEVRRTAMWALGQIESPAALPSLISALESEDAEVRQTAAWSLGQIEDARAVDGLKRALRSPDAELRETAAWALGQIESPAAVDGLIALVTDDVAAVREAAVHALAQIEDPAAAPAMVRVLSDANPDLREMAAHALAEMDLPAAPPALVAALRDADADVRMAAAHALGHIADAASVSALTAALQDANSDVQLAAMHALLEMDEDIAADALLQMLQHEDPEVRKHAAEALGDH